MARKALAWAVEHFDVPDGWESQSLTFGGIRDEARRAVAARYGHVFFDVRWADGDDVSRLTV